MRESASFFSGSAGAGVEAAAVAAVATAGSGVAAEVSRFVPEAGIAGAASGRILDVSTREAPQTAGELIGTTLGPAPAKFTDSFLMTRLTNTFSG